MRGALPGLTPPFPLGETLPAVYRDKEFTQLLCQGLDEVLAPVLATLDSLPAYLDPATAPGDHFLPPPAGRPGVPSGSTFVRSKSPGRTARSSRRSAMERIVPG